MHALCLHEPYASLIADGTKTIETRTWWPPPGLIGKPLLICVTKQSGGPLAGMAIAVTTVADFRPMRSEDESDACCDVYLGAWSWFLRRTRRIRPFAVKGARRIFQVDIRERDLSYED